MISMKNTTKDKKIHCIAIVLLFCIFITDIRTTLGQTQVTRYTPLGSTVRAYNNIPEMTSGDKADWSYYVSIK